MLIVSLLYQIVFSTDGSLRLKPNKWNERPAKVHSTHLHTKLLVYFDSKIVKCQLFHILNLCWLTKMALYLIENQESKIFPKWISLSPSKGDKYVTFYDQSSIGSFGENVNLKNSQNEIVFDRLCYGTPCPSYCSPP